MVTDLDGAIPEAVEVEGDLATAVTLDATMPPLAVDVDGALTVIESVTWTEEAIELEGLLEEAP